jgi:hypothetical protein
MTRKKTAKPKKITGVVGSLSAKQIRVDTPKGDVWQIKRTRSTKVKVISGKPLKQLSVVTVEFATHDGKLIGVRSPGKRTETGTVIGLTSSLITLQTATDGTWNISRNDDNTVVKAGTLALNSDVIITFFVPPGALA